MEYFSQEVDLEHELRMELEKLDQIFLSDHHLDATNTSTISDRVFSPGRLSYSAYEYAEAEIEKEEMHDKLQLLLSKTEDYDAKLLEMNKMNLELKSRNDQYQRENERLLHYIKELEENQQKNSNQNGTITSSTALVSTGNPRNNENGKQRTEEEFRQLEFKLAETRSKLARTQQAYEDLSLAKDSALIELEKERMIRIHAERERDAYSAAYEQSLLHFEKWTAKSKGGSRFAWKA